MPGMRSGGACGCLTGAVSSTIPGCASIHFSTPSPSLPRRAFRPARGEALEDHADAGGTHRPRFTVVDRGQVPAAEADVAGGGLQEPVEHAQQQGLAGPGQARDDEDVTTKIWPDSTVKGASIKAAAVPSARSSSRSAPALSRSTASSGRCVVGSSGLSGRRPNTLNRLCSGAAPAPAVPGETRPCSASQGVHHRSRVITEHLHAAHTLSRGWPRAAASGPTRCWVGGGMSVACRWRTA